MGDARTARTLLDLLLLLFIYLSVDWLRFILPHRVISGDTLFSTVYVDRLLYAILATLVGSREFYCGNLHATWSTLTSKINNFASVMRFLWSILLFLIKCRNRFDAASGNWMKSVPLVNNSPRSTKIRSTHISALWWRRRDFRSLAVNETAFSNPILWNRRRRRHLKRLRSTEYFMREHSHEYEYESAHYRYLRCLFSSLFLAAENFVCMNK